MTWERLQAGPRPVYAAVVEGDIVRVEFTQDPLSVELHDVLFAARAARRDLAGCFVRQFAVGAPGFGYEELGRASDVPITIWTPKRAG